MISGADEQVRVRLTVVDPSRVGARADVLVAAARGTPAGAVAEQLRAAVGRPGGRAGDLFVDGVPVTGAVLGLPPLLEGAVVTVGRAGGPTGRAAGTRGGLAEVHVVAGPDAGARHPLAPGTTRVGRGGGAGLRLADPDVSRAHAEVVATGGTVEVRDLGSTNGTRVGARAVGAATTRWPPGELLRVGASTLALRSPAGTADAGGPAATTPDGAGRLLVNPAPRLLPPPVAGAVTFPDAPPDPVRTRLPWVALLLPLLLSVPLAWWLHQAVFLAFALLSPLMMLGQHLADRRERRGERAAAAERHRAATDAALAELAALLTAERSRLLLDRPDPATVAAVAAGPLQRLWERRPEDGDELVLRLGLGSRRPAVDVRGCPPAGVAPPVLTGVPVTVDLVAEATGGVAGLAGPRREVLALARGLVGQAVVANSPRRLHVVVLAADGDPDGDWEWAARLPHACPDLPAPPRRDPGAGPGGHRSELGTPGEGPRTLLVLDGAARLRRDPRVAALLAAAGDRLVALCLDDDAARLPAECGATVRLVAAGGEPGATLAVRGADPRPLAPDLVSPAWAERLGRDLARLADATPAVGDGGLPAQVRLVDLLGGPDGASIAAGWSRCRAGRDRATTAVVGVTRTGPWHLDLARHGPHALVAGTTGAGKSELLTTLVAGLAVAHPPDRLNLLLVDYKGGTAFGPLGELPHTAGVLTDLDEHLARRALSSLRAELRRREALLRAAGAGDLDGYERARPPHGPVLPRLVIVVDEFRVLADELPDLLTGLVRVAVVGRSLGVHLVLATQRPAGVVTAEIRANVNLRIALRVRDRTDSEDVVEAPDAALLPADRPGRGLFRAGGEELVAFQAARATGRPVPVTAAPRVIPLRRRGPVATAWREHATPPGAGPPPKAADGTAAGADDLAGLVAACREAAARDGVPPVRAPWLPPLPAIVRPDDVAALLAAGAAAAPTGSGGSVGSVGPAGSGGTATGLVLGVADLPGTQSRGALRWSPPAEGHLAVVGAPGTGRTGVVRATVGAACRSPWPVHVHVVDGGGRLADLAELPRVGTVVPAADTERAARLLARLTAAGHGTTGITARGTTARGTTARGTTAHGTTARGTTARGSASGSSGPVRPRADALVLVVIDGWEQVLDAWLPVEHGRLVDDLLRLARDGLGAGVRFLVTGGRTLLGGAVGGVLTERLLLRPADPTDLVLAGVPAGELPPSMPPGRVVRVGGGSVVEAQVVLDDPATDPACRHVGPGERAPLRLAPLPDVVTTTQLIAQLAAAPGGVSAALADGLLPLGLGGDDARPLGPPGRGPGWLVAGAPGSGRSTALATAARVLRAGGRPVVTVAASPSPLADVPPVDGTTVSPAALRSGTTDLLRMLDALPRATLVLDDVMVLADTRAEDDLLARLEGHGPGAVSWPDGPGPHVLAGCAPGQAAMAFRGLAARLRTSGAGLLLTPCGPGDGEAFGVRVPAAGGGPPGRALVVTASGVQAVQVAGG